MSLKQIHLVEKNILKDQVILISNQNLKIIEKEKQYLIGMIIITLKRNMKQHHMNNQEEEKENMRMKKNRKKL